MIYTEKAFSDLGRLADFLLQTEPGFLPETVALISEAVSVLKNHPLIGRAAEQGLRELVISRGRSGYIALYSYEPEQDTVLLLSIRHQREAGYVAE